MKQVDLVAGDVTGTVWRCSSTGYLSSIDDASVDCALPAPPGPTPWWRAGSIPNLWAYACWFLKPPDSDQFWKVRKHGAFSIPRKALGLRPTDHSCHHETWLHLDFVDWKWSQPRLDESDRVQLKERPTPYQYGQRKRRISDVFGDHSLSSWPCDHSHALFSKNVLRRTSTAIGAHQRFLRRPFVLSVTVRPFAGVFIPLRNLYILTKWPDAVSHPVAGMPQGRHVSWFILAFFHSRCTTSLTNIMSWRKKKRVFACVSPKGPPSRTLAGSCSSCAGLLRLRDGPRRRISPSWLRSASRSRRGWQSHKTFDASRDRVEAGGSRGSRGWRGSRTERGDPYGDPYASTHERPHVPSQKEREQHEMTHLPFRSWCWKCVFEESHWRNTVRESCRWCTWTSVLRPEGASRRHGAVLGHAGRLSGTLWWPQWPPKNDRIVCG